MSHLLHTVCVDGLDRARRTLICLEGIAQHGRSGQGRDHPVAAVLALAPAAVVAGMKAPPRWSLGWLAGLRLATWRQDLVQLVHQVTEVPCAESRPGAVAGDQACRQYRPPAARCWRKDHGFGVRRLEPLPADHRIDVART